MQLIKSWLASAFLILALFLFSCKGDYEVAPSGMKYKFLVHKDGPKPIQGDYVQMRLSYLATVVDSNSKETKDSVLFSSDVDEFLTGEPLIVRIGKVPYAGSPNEMLLMMSKGDSIEMLTHPDSFYIHHISGAPASSVIKREDMLKVRIKLLDFMKSEEMEKKMKATQSKRQEQSENRMKETEKELDALTKPLGKNVIKTAGGTFVHVTKKGNGPKIIPESPLMVTYRGTLLDGTEFDQGEFPMQVGTSSVIQGWKEALMELSIGDEATLYIPFWQAYGEQAMGKIPPYSTLIFYIKVKPGNVK